MQEEEATPNKKRSYFKQEYKGNSKSKWHNQYSDDTKHVVKQLEG
jgi:hypothetical protein